MYFVFNFNKGPLSLADALIYAGNDYTTACKEAKSIQGFVLDGANGDMINFAELTWETRAVCNSRPDAIELIANQLAQLNSDCDISDLSEIESFARRFEIPFSSELYLKFSNKLISKVAQDIDWNSSNCW